MTLHPAPPLVVVGASAGGVEALRDLVAQLPTDFPACVLVVLHIPPSGTSALPAILDRAGPLPARAARAGDRLEPGRVLVGVPDHHLVVLSDSVTLTRGPHENGHRPAVDVLFRSAARHHGGRVNAVVLSGSLDDGAAGMVAVRRRGGQGVVQDFNEALYAAMPRAAAIAGEIEHVLPAAKIAPLLSELISAGPAVPVGAAGDLMTRETDVAGMDAHEMHDPQRPGVPAGLGCPSCGGSLFQIEEGSLVRFRCRVGHAWSPESLLEQQTLALESALWMAIRSLEEKVALVTELGERATERGYERTASRFSESAHDARDAAEMVRRLVNALGAGRTTLTNLEEPSTHDE
jgi:two-component system, chemotaxis family, protein-glutamate methylesterase/glutaminase